MPNYRLKCQNTRCGAEVVRNYLRERFEQISASSDGHRCQRCNTPKMRYMISNTMLKDRTFDGWGWHDGLNMFFRGPNHYRSYLKEQGLIEVGNDPFPTQKRANNIDEFFSEDLLRETAQITGGLDGQLIKALKDTEKEGAKNEASRL